MFGRIKEREVKKIPVARDFVTEDNTEWWPFVEDEDSRGLYGYGHMEKTYFAGQANDYFYHLGSECGIENAITEEQVQHHVGSNYRDEDGYLKWDIDRVDETHPEAFPLTVVRL